MTRQRPLKVYVSSDYPSKEIMAAIRTGDPRANDRQANFFVAARSLREAAVLLRTNIGSSDRMGGVSIYTSRADHADLIRETTLAKPGQVFVTKYERGRERNMVEVSVSLENPRTFVLGQQGDLTLGEALLAKEADSKARAKAEDERRARERAARKEHSQQTSRAIREALERMKPALEALGINPATVVEGRGPQGVTMPAEVAERLVAMAIELDEVMGS